MLFSPEFPTAQSPRRPIRNAVAGSAIVAVTAIGGAVALATSAGAAETVWDRVAMCESGGNWSINTGNGYYGGLQFAPRTWTGFGGGAYAATADKATKTQQILIAQKVLKVQGPGAWPVCSVRAGLTLANGSAPITGGSTTPPPPVSRDFARPLVVDGVVGRLTKGAAEKWFGGTVNGAWSTDDVKKLQNKVGSAPDGDIGPLTTKALQRTVGADIDGIWGPQTSSYFQRFLNRNVYGR